MIKRHKIINLAIIIIGIGLVISLSRDILRLLKSGDRVKLAQLQVKELEVKQAELEKQKEYYQSQEFVEEQARNKLNLSQEEETVVILPPNVEELVGYEPPREPEKIPNWQQWWRLFF